MKKRGSKIVRVVTWCMGIAVILCALYIMANGLGLVDSLDFGAGAYYYADIPAVERFDHKNAYRSPVPMWVCIVLFLAWGWLMYRLWVWLEQRNQRHDQQSNQNATGKK